MPDQNLSNIFQNHSFGASDPDTIIDSESVVTVAPRRTILNPSFSERNTRGGAPLDMETGGPTWLKMKLAVTNDPELKLQVANEYTGNTLSRFSDEGDVIVRDIDETGKHKDLLVNERGFKASDLAAFITGNLSEAYGAIGGSILASKLPLLKKLTSGYAKTARTIVGASVGANVSGAVLEDIPYALSSEDLEVVDVLSQRAKQVPVDVVLNTAGIGLFKVLGKIVTPFGTKPGSIQYDQEAAKKYFKKKYNLDYPATIGEQTGNRAVLGAEATMERLHGSGGSFKDLRDKKIDFFAKLQNRMLGLDDTASRETRNKVLPDIEKLGSDALDQLGQKFKRRFWETEVTRGKLDADVANTILKEFDALVLPGRQVHPELVGKAIRDSFINRRDAFRTKRDSLYNKLEGLGASQRSQTPDALVAEARKIRAQLVRSAPPGGAQQVLNSLNTKKIPKVLDDIIALDGTKVSLNDLRRIRSSLSDEIADIKAIAGKSDHEFLRIKTLVDNQANKLVESLPDGKLKDAWKAADEFNKTHSKEFQDRSVQRLFAPPGANLEILDDQIVNNILTSGGASSYRSYKQYLGGADPAFRRLKRAIADKVFDSSTQLGGETLDGKRFLSALESFRNVNRSAYDDIFGRAADRLITEGRILIKAGDSLPINEVEKRLFSGSSSFKKLSELKAEQVRLKREYRGEILGKINTGNMDSLDINPNEFVRKFYRGADLSEVKKIKGALTPEVNDRIKIAVMEDVFYQAQTKSVKDGASQLMDNSMFSHPMSRALKTVIGDRTSKEKLIEILGRTGYNDLNQMATLLEGSEVARATFSAAGGIGAGMMVLSAIRKGPLGYASDWVKQKAAAIIMLTPATRKWASNTLITESRNAAFWNAIVASEPFLKAAAENTANNELPAFLSELKSSIDMFFLNGEANSPRVPVQQRQNSMRDALEQKVFPVEARP